MNEQSIPEVAPLPRLADQVQTTDIALRAWREESVRRRAAYDARETELTAANRAWWRRNLRRTLFAFGAGGAMGLAIAFVGLGTAPAPRAVEAAPAAAPPLAEVAPVPEEVIVAPVAVAVAEPVVEETISPLQSASTVSVVPGSASTWKDTGYHWVKFQVAESELVKIAWRDGAGVSVLEPMNCGSLGDGVRSCLAGRSHQRIAHAIEQGATAGTWTVEACAPEGCAPVTTFAAP